VDHKEQHHQHHEKEREHEKRKEHLHEQAQERQPRSLHPGWLVGLAVVFILAAVVIWTVFFRPA
jgi:hypothetical protein